jgi:hypothetical protein
MIKYFTKQSRNRIAIFVALMIFILSLFLPYIYPYSDPVQEGLDGSETAEIDEYSRFYLDAIMDDISLNDPKMNSLFSIDLLKSVGDIDINNTLNDLDLIIPDKIKKVKERMKESLPLKKNEKSKIETHKNETPPPPPLPSTSSN